MGKNINIVEWKRFVAITVIPCLVVLSMDLSYILTNIVNYLIISCQKYTSNIN